MGTVIVAADGNRTCSQPPRPTAEPGFLRHARDYFVHTPRQPVTRELTVLAADAEPDDVAQAVEALVTFWAR